MHIYTCQEFNLIFQLLYKARVLLKNVVMFLKIWTWLNVFSFRDVFKNFYG